MINVANGEYNKVVPRASGEAEQKIQAAEGYALKRVNEAEGDVSRFNAVFAEYLKAPKSPSDASILRRCERSFQNLARRSSSTSRPVRYCRCCNCHRMRKEPSDESTSSFHCCPDRGPAAFFVFSAAYTVSETEQVIITQFGKPVGDPVTEPGCISRSPSSRKSRGSKNASWNGTAAQMRCRPKTRPISWLTPSGAGGSMTPSNTFCV